ncbi:MAG: DUF2267 domain-containing protein [Rhodospirillales bacterium]|nr:MAG: DUF2267 domain-containing protein [Rhodospirillales bacterium]
MSRRGLSVFDETRQLTNMWLNELSEEMGWEDRHRAYLGLRLVLQAIRDHLSPDEAVHLGAQLPMLVRGFYYEGWRPAKTPDRNRSVDAFLRRIEDGFRQTPGDEYIDPAELTAAVFAVLRRRISAGEFDQVLHALPRAIRKLAPEQRKARAVA